MSETAWADSSTSGEPDALRETLDVSVVVPTYCESENLAVLVPRLCEVFAEHDLRGEIVVVDDDSPDGTADVCRELAELYPVRCLVRRGERGLSGAVIAGLAVSTGAAFVVMDADLSHPPEAIPSMLDRLAEPDVDFVIGSRYVDGGSTADDWGPVRWVNSKVATLLARTLTSPKDPMAGFFALHPETFHRCHEQLAPLGYKIGLELTVKGHCRRVEEVPIHFSDRVHGESKLNLKEQVNYLRHLGRLYGYRFPTTTRALLFGLVGLTGMVIDLLSFAVLVALSVPFGLSRAAAILLAMTWNFTLHRTLTFDDRPRGPVFRQYVVFCASCLLGAAVNWGTSAWLFANVVTFARQPLLSAGVGVVAGFVFNFVLCNTVVFGRRQPTVADDTDVERGLQNRSADPKTSAVTH